MKKWLIIIGILLLILFVVVIPACNSYNGMVTKDENVKSAWAQVENVYQRRADLIPNLVETVKGYANFEKQTLTDVIEARAKATQTNVNLNNAESFQNFQKAQDGLSSALSRLMVVVEKYPDLKANQNFLDLQAQLEGTENRITTERMKFNQVAQDYNTYIRRFPKNIYASIFGFDAKEYFKAEQGSEKAPKVKF